MRLRLCGGHFLILLLFCTQFSTVFACQNGCKCEAPTTTNCASSALRSFPILLNPRITYLDLSDNQITKLSADELAIYRDLEILILKNNSISDLSAETFTALSKLKHLDISGNNLLALNVNVFKGLGQLETLHLDYNDIELSPDSFSGLTSLRALSLSHNSLAFMPAGVLQTVSQLHHLDLSSNKLLSISPSMFSSVPQLKSIKLENNLISTLESGLFSAQKELQILDLSNNLISDIEEGALFGLHSLQLLNLTNNQLLRLPGNTWPLPRLRVLDLSSNLFVSLETASFDSLPSLQYLNISYSRNLKSIQMSAFVSLSSLHWLSLASSSLISLSPAAFSPHPPLRHLDISNNQLITIPHNFLSTNKIHKLYLAGNPWDCTCELRELALTPIDTALCAGPEGVAALKVGELSPCSMFAGMLIPVALALVVLFLCVVTLTLACYRPKAKKQDRSNFYNDPLINVLSHKEIAFDRPICSPYTSPTELNGSDSSGGDSAYESPTSAQARRLLPPYYAGSSLNRTPLPGAKPIFVAPLPPPLNSSRLTIYQPYSMAAPTVRPPPIPREKSRENSSSTQIFRSSKEIEDDENDYKVIDDYPARL